MFENIEIGDEVILYWNKLNGVIPDERRNDWSRYPDRRTSKVYGKRNDPESDAYPDAILIEGLGVSLNWDGYSHRYKEGTFSPEVININCYEIFHDECIVKHIPAHGRSVSKLDMSGMTCFSCKNGYPYAEPNFQKDKLICWSCRDSNKWKYKMIGNEVVIL